MTQASNAELQGRITIMLPDGSIRTVPLGTREVTIGRSADNDIVLDDASISAQHARIQPSASGYRIVDLNSTNGTLLGNVRLLPGVPEVWPPDKAVRIGDCWLRLERAEPSAGQPASTPPPVAATPHVAAFVETPDLAVDPGAAVTLTVTVLNQGPVVDHLHVAVANLPPDWLPGPAPVIRLLPGARQPVSLIIAPPRKPGSCAGVYSLTVRVSSQDAPDQFAEVQARLTVNPYAQFKGELKPQSVRAGRPAQLHVENQGNTPQTYALSWQDRAEALAFDARQRQLSLNPGEAAFAEFRARPHKRAFIGGQKSYSFTAEVASPSGEKQVLAGEAVSHALIPRWLPPLILVLLLGALALLYVRLMPDRKPPLIRWVTIDPIGPLAGQPVTIHWVVENAQSIDLSPVAAGLNPKSGQYTIPGGLPASMSIVLVAHNRYGESQQSISVTVREPTATPSPEPGRPEVKLFEATPSSVYRGQEVTLRWQVQGADIVEIDAFGTVGFDGEQKVVPQATTSYLLTASKQGNTVWRKVDVFVVEPPTPTPTFVILRPPSIRNVLSTPFWRSLATPSP